MNSSVARDPVLLVTSGPLSGQRHPVRLGLSAIGRDTDADIRLPDEDVSRRHAQIERDTVRLLVRDVGSRNGTWVNGSRISKPCVLTLGDELRIGSTSLRLEGTDGGRTSPAVDRPGPLYPTMVSRSSSPVADHRGRVSLGRIAWVGGLVYVLLALLGVVTQQLTDWTGYGPWIAVPLGALAAALLEVVREALQRGRSTPGVEERGPSSPRRTSAGVAVVVTVLLLGGAGAAAAYGIATLSAYISGNQVGAERLVADVKNSSKGVTTTVTSVEHTADFTRVRITVHNGLDDTIRLGLWENATMSDPEITLEADSSRSSWADTIAPRQNRSGTIVFPGHLTVEPTTATLAFAHVFGSLDGPQSIVVDGLALGPA